MQCPLSATLWFMSLTDTPGTLEEWCLKHMDVNNLTFDVIDLERLFRARCEQFLTGRAMHGFSGSTYKPRSAPRW